MHSAAAAGQLYSAAPRRASAAWLSLAVQKFEDRALVRRRYKMDTQCSRSLLHPTNITASIMPVDSATALATVARPTLFIDGQWRKAADGELRPTINPFDQSVIQELDEAGPQDAEAAIKAARHFFDTSSWADPTKTTYAQRAKSLSAIADLLQKFKEELATIETIDTGKTFEESKIDIDDVTTVCRFYAKEALKYDSPRLIKDEAIPETVTTTVAAEPVGVCVLIMPWNYPILQFFWKLAPALVAGNAVIIKPSEVTPLSTVYVVRKILQDPSVDLPVGAFQLLTAGGARVGPSMTESPDVDLVSFTGGLSTGRRIIQSCAGTVKKTLVELGGKNPNVVFGDVDLDWAADVVATGVFLHSGQVCSSGARLIVDESIADALIEKVIEKARNVRMGSGLDPASETGPLVSKEHLEKIKGYVELGKSEGAKLLVGGTQPDFAKFPHLAKGNFFLPTIFDGCNGKMRIVQEETFGPILTVERFPHNDEAAAIRLANDTPFGLAAGVQSKDRARAERVAKKIRAGTTWINTYGPYTAAAEWGGFGSSGTGRELGEEGLREYLSLKTTFVEKKPALMNWFTSKI